MTLPTQKLVHGLHGAYSVAGDAISKGGVGRIYRTTDPKWVYKEYLSPDKAPPSDRLQRLVQVGREVLIQQGHPIGSTPESSINWPVDIVRAPDGRLSGCVLPAIPQKYFHPTLGGVNTLDFLIMRRSSPPPAQSRLVVLLRLAEILAFVHAKGLVHGDVNAKNVAWTLDPQPAAYLIDCDGMVPQDPPPTTGVAAPYWTDPRIVDKVVPAHDQYSDWYCLALAFYRGLLLIQGGSLGKQNGSWSAPGQIPNDLDPRVAALMRRGLTDPLDPSRRPEPSEWVRTLIEVYVPNNQYDTKAITSLDKAIAAPKPSPQFQPNPQFHQLPPTITPPRPTQPVRPQPPQQHNPPPQPYGFPPPGHQPPQQPYAPPPQLNHYPPPPQPYGPPPQVVHHPPPPQPTGSRGGGLARWAMAGGSRWWVPWALMTFGCWPVGLVIATLVLVQVLPMPSGFYGRTSAIVSSAITILVGSIFLLSALFS